MYWQRVRRGLGCGFVNLTLVRADLRLDDARPVNRAASNEDANLNWKLDAGEDLNGNGILDRFPRLPDMSKRTAATLLIETVLITALLTVALDMKAHSRVERLGGVNVWALRERVEGGR